MPMRLLFYMIEVWRDLLKNTDKREMKRKNFKLPAVFLLDQEMSEEELIRRLRKTIDILKKISPEQFSVFKQWLKKIVKPRMKDELQKEVDDEIIIKLTRFRNVFNSIWKI